VVFIIAALDPCAARDGDDLAGDIRCSCTEVHDHFRIVFGLSDARQGHRRLRRGVHVAERTLPIRIHIARCNPIDPNGRREASSQLSGQSREPGLGRRVGRAAAAAAEAATDTVLTTAPFASVNAAASVLVIQKALSKLIRKILSQKSSVNASRSAAGIGVRVPGAPALLTK